MGLLEIVARRSMSLVGIAALFVLALFFNWADLDRRFSALFFDSGAHRFLLKNDPLWNGWIYGAQRGLAILMWASLLGAWLYLKFSKQDRSAACGFLAFTLVVSGIAALTVGQLKGVSAHSCPWSLAQYSGTANFFYLGQAAPANAGPGHCFPSGHSAAAFMWIAGIYASRRWFGKGMLPIGAGVVLFGISVGLLQIARGAHFVSHVLTAAALSWGIAYLADLFVEFNNLQPPRVAHALQEGILRTEP